MTERVIISSENASGASEHRMSKLGGSLSSAVFLGLALTVGLAWAGPATDQVKASVSQTS